LGFSSKTKLPRPCKMLLMWIKSRNKCLDHPLLSLHSRGIEVIWNYYRNKIQMARGHNQISITNMAQRQGHKIFQVHAINLGLENLASEKHKFFENKDTFPNLLCLPKPQHIKFLPSIFYCPSVSLNLYYKYQHPNPLGFLWWSITRRPAQRKRRGSPFPISKPFHQLQS